MRLADAPLTDYAVRQRDLLTLAGVLAAECRFQSLAADRWHAAAQMWAQTNDDESLVTRDVALAVALKKRMPTEALSAQAA